MKEKLDLSYFLRYLQTMLSDVTLYCTLFGECKLVNIDSDKNIEVKFADNKSWVFNRYGECLYGGGECVLFRTWEKLDWRIFMRQEMEDYLKHTEYPEVTHISTGETYSVMKLGNQYVLEQFCKSQEKPTLTIDSIDNLVLDGFVPVSDSRKSKTIVSDPTEETSDTVDSVETPSEATTEDKDFEINKTKAIMETILLGALWVKANYVALTYEDITNSLNKLCDKYNLKTDNNE